MATLLGNVFILLTEQVEQYQKYYKYVTAILCTLTGAGWLWFADTSFMLSYEWINPDDLEAVEEYETGMMIACTVMCCLYYALLSQYHKPNINDIMKFTVIYAFVHPLITIYVYKDFEEGVRAWDTLG